MSTPLSSHHMARAITDLFLLWHSQGYDLAALCDDPAPGSTSPIPAPGAASSSWQGEHLSTLQPDNQEEAA